MAQLKTTFAGLTLNNPIIISSSGLTNSLAKIQKLEEAGAGAVVLKSVFEEQINMQAGSMQGYGSPEADDYLGAYVRSHALNEHITLIEDVKKHCKIPVIASINCYSDSEWTDFARLMEEAGADALELNILSLQTSKDYTPGSFEQRHIDILRHIKKVVHIPVIMKLGSNLTNPVALVNQLYANGAAAVVLFNPRRPHGEASRFRRHTAPLSHCRARHRSRSAFRRCPAPCRNHTAWPWWSRYQKTWSSGPGWSSLPRRPPQ